MTDDVQESRGGVTFAGLVPALHSNRAAAFEAVKRMREPKLLLNDKDKFEANKQNETNQTEYNEDPCTCRPCNTTLENDRSGREWLQFMECKAWEHSTCCGKCTIWTFFANYVCNR